MCVDPASGGSEGASNAGTEALVRRFSAPLGTGGTGGIASDEAAREGPSDSCDDDAWRALAACSSAAYTAAGTAGLGALIAGTSCLGAALGLIECLDNHQQASKPYRGRP